MYLTFMSRTDSYREDLIIIMIINRIKIKISFYKINLWKNHLEILFIKIFKDFIKTVNKKITQLKRLNVNKDHNKMEMNYIFKQIVQTCINLKVLINKVMIRNKN